MPHPPFSLHAVSSYPWQPMISFSLELGGRPPARRGVFAFVWDFDTENEGLVVGGGDTIEYKLPILTIHSL